MGTRRRDSKAFGLVILGILILGAVAAGLTLMWPMIRGAKELTGVEETDTYSDDTNGNNSIEDTKKTKPFEVDFQPTVDEWIKTVGGNKSILIYDLNLDKIVGSYNIEEKYDPASLYKLFVVYEGYKRIEAGVWDGEKKAGSTGYTISKCLDLSIRESHSPCAETLWGMIGRDTLDKIIKTEWGITESDISKLTSNISDITKIMKRFYEHPDFNDSTLLEKMWDSFLNQPKTTYNWRQGLPSGFSKASVYNKVGWDYDADKKYWNIYHDTAIVKFPLKDGTTRDFIVTVMTNKVDYKYIKKFGNLLENAFLTYLEQN